MGKGRFGNGKRWRCQGERHMPQRVRVTGWVVFTLQDGAVWGPPEQGKTPPKLGASPGLSHRGRRGHGAHHCRLQVIIGHLSTGKVIIEEEMKEEMKEDVDPHNGADDGKCGACPPTLGGGMDPSLARPPHHGQWNHSSVSAAKAASVCSGRASHTGESLSGPT